MAISVTKAALEMEQRSESITPHEVISLLLDGALERAEQARETLQAGDTELAGQFMTRLVGIINGLRASLDFDKGGEVAHHLESVYEYLVERLCVAEADNGDEILTETKHLLGDLKNGWDAIAA